jgi:hypothetical protein
MTCSKKRESGLDSDTTLLSKVTFGKEISSGGVLSLFEEIDPSWSILVLTLATWEESELDLRNEAYRTDPNDREDDAPSDFWLRLLIRPKLIPETDDEWRR